MRGQSYLPNDQDFSSIKTVRHKTNHLYVPSVGADLILNARRTNPFTVTAMDQESFVSPEPVSKAFINWKKNTQKQKVDVDWLQVKRLRVTKGKLLQFQYQYSLNSLEAWKVVDLKRRCRGRPPDFTMLPTHQLYNQYILVSPYRQIKHCTIHIEE